MSRRWRITLGVVLGVIALSALALQVSSSPRLCTSCHEMRPRAASWGRSAHSEVDCVTCHAGPYEWYQVPQALFARGRLLARCTVAHVSGDYEDPVDSRPAGVPPMQDEVCLHCHDVNRQSTSGFRILIDHPEHAKRNGSCVSCHVRTAHPLPSRSKALSLMTQCYTCHGTTRYPEASRECNVCHPPDYEPLPESHAAKTWARSHGKTSQSDPQQCPMCHKKSFCTDCHGVQMPHPAGWDKGHAPTAERDRQICTRCHLDKPDLCSMCHHKGWEPEKGPWIEQHPLMVAQRGTAFCMGCHEATFCTACHVRRADFRPTAN